MFTFALIAAALAVLTIIFNLVCAIRNIKAKRRWEQARENYNRMSGQLKTARLALENAREQAAKPKPASAFKGWSPRAAKPLPVGRKSTSVRPSDSTDAMNGMMMGIVAASAMDSTPTPSYDSSPSTSTDSGSFGGGDSGSF